MQRPRFGIVTAVVSTLVVFGVMAKYLQGQIPTVNANRLGNSPNRFLAQAASQSIDWQPFDERVFSKALNRGVPILLVTGSAESRFGRDADKGLLNSPDVMTLLRHSFVCARVDVDDTPRWASAFLPMSRVRSSYLVNFGIYVLSGKGRLVATYLPGTPLANVDAKSLVAFLARAELDAARDGPEVDTQSEELNALTQGQGPGLPDFGAHLASLIQFDNPKGGFPFQGRQDLLPFAWRYMLLEGRFDAFQTSIDPVLLSPAVNLLDGGFFRDARSPDWSQVDFDESAQLDAEMMWTLALGAAATGDPFYRKLAERAFDRLAGDFGDTEWVAASQVGDEKDQDRSARYSFSPRALRDVLPDSARRDWAQQHLRLRVSENPLMVPSLVSKDVLLRDSKTLNECLDQFRAARTQPRTFGATGLLEVNGLVASRLIACARLWNDTTRLQKALDLALRFDTYRASDDVSRTPVAGERKPGSLADYLAYSDSCLETFLATGRLDRLREGAKVLRRAIFLFGTSNPGVFVLDSAPGRVPLDANPPEILDRYRESTCSYMIRLSLAYGTLMGKGGADLKRVAYDTGSRFSGIANEFGPFDSGYFCASARLSRAEGAFCVGPRADQLARDLYLRVPTRLVAIVGGEVRPDLAKKAPGIYFARGEDVVGPLTVEAAARIMPLAFPFDAPTPR